MPPCFIWDPAWIAAALSGIAAVLAALAWLKSGKSDPASVAAVSAVSELSTRVEQLRTLVADNSQRDRQDAEARARLFRDEIGGQFKDGFTRFDDASRGLRGGVIKFVTTLGETTAGSVDKLGQVQSEKLGDIVQRVQLLSDATERRLTDVKKEAAESGKALREEVNTQLQALLVAIRDTLQQIGTTQKESLDQVGDQLRRLTQRNVEMIEQLRNTIEERLEIPKTNFLHGICTKAMMSASEHNRVWFGVHGRLTHGPTSVLTGPLLRGLTRRGYNVASVHKHKYRVESGPRGGPRRGR